MGLLSYRCEGAIKRRQCAAIKQRSAWLSQRIFFCYSALMYSTPIDKPVGICSMNKKQFEFADIFGFHPALPIVKVIAY
jgi:hypothetical protein